ncbi:MAG: DJ-1/PfpI family protein [Ruminococcaceae bacterium]|nr:DJ-1/PfpI family protein [Oscillospiraceae bacterium]
MVYVFLADGFEEIEALTVVDVLRRGEIDAETVSIANSEVVVGAHGISVLADRSISDVCNKVPDMIVLPGGMPGSNNLKECALVREMLCNVNRAGGYLAAICAAPIVLGACNLLEGKKAVCYPGFESELGAQIVDGKVVKDGNIITAKGPGCAIDFALTLVERLKGWTVAYSIGEGMLHEDNVK